MTAGRVLGSVAVVLLGVPLLFVTALIDEWDPEISVQRTGTAQVTAACRANGAFHDYRYRCVADLVRWDGSTGAQTSPIHPIASNRLLRGEVPVQEQARTVVDTRRFGQNERVVTETTTAGDRPRLPPGNSILGAVFSVAGAVAALLAIWRPTSPRLPRRGWR